ncbi:MAG: hypothetical protein ACRCW5_11030 [Cetobacterium sp.]|uniref:hypothetical protein n=1 Tax=Cetobacterium sp. TaxID=2071632 RepID=UPI003F3AA7CE
MITIISIIIISIAAYLTGVILTNRKIDKHKVTKRYLNLSSESRRMIDGHFIAREAFDARKKSSEDRRISGRGD